jgi:hypothetical protein
MRLCIECGVNPVRLGGDECADCQTREEFEQQCERCGGYFEAAEESSLCPECEAA